MTGMTGCFRQPIDIVLGRLTTLHPKFIDLGLGRTQRLLEALGNPEKFLPPVIHVAGTNGKGSTIAFMREIAIAAGLQVHVYTSPHLVRFNERIVLNGVPVNEAALLSVLEECEIANAGEPITFFEITTVAALLTFSRTPADLLLLETGLGGRFDSTNVIENPAMTVITPVSMDHMSFLGATIAEIAFEKAGILKSGVPCVVAPQVPDALSVIEARAQDLNSSLYISGFDWTSRSEPGAMVYCDGDREIYLPEPSLAGVHQRVNAATAIAALRSWERHLWSVEDICEGISTAKWPGRLQHLSSGRLADLLPEGWELWLDGGHNPSAGAALMETIAAWPEDPVVLVCAMQENKDARGFLEPLATVADSLAAIDLPGGSPGYAPKAIAEIASILGLESKVATSLSAALGEAANGPTGRVLVCGSLYLVGEVIAANSSPIQAASHYAVEAS